MSCELDCDDLKNVGFEELIRKMVVKTEDGCYALRVVDEGAGGGGGSYTFPTNHGNTAYVATGGDDGTGVVGNISKPFLTLQAAIDALSVGSPAQVVILSGSTDVTVTEYDYATMPTVLTIENLSHRTIAFEGSCSFDTLYINTPGIIRVATTLFFVTNNYGKIKCREITFTDTVAGTVGSGIDIECDVFTVSGDMTATTEFGYINWKKSIDTGGLTIIYTRCNPKIITMNLNQSGTSAPITDVLENSTGATVSASYTTIGAYELVFSSAIFPDSSKVIIHQGSFPVGSVPGQGVNISVAATDTIGIESFDDFPANANDILVRYSLRLEIYP